MLDRFLASRRRSAQEAALQLELLAEFAVLDRDELDPTGEYTHLEIAAITHSGERFVRNWLDLAETVTARLPRALAALRAGDVDLYQVRRLAEATDVLSADVATRVEGELLPQLGEWSPRQLGYYLRKAVDRADPAAAAARAAARQDARQITHTALDDGAGLLQIQGDVERTQLAFDRVRAIARQLKTSGDTRTMDQLTADVALDCLAGKEFQHAKVHVWLTLPATTALGVDDKPGELAGYGWIPAQRALELAAREDATWQRVLTDPATGQVLDVGRSKYRPPAALRDHLHANHPTCTGPGCRRPAHLCDNDHLVPFPQGPTDEENMRPHCRPHHRVKTHGGWRVKKTTNGGLVWITKHGYRFQYQPDPITDPEPTTNPLTHHQPRPITNLRPITNPGPITDREPTTNPRSTTNPGPTTNPRSTTNPRPITNPGPTTKAQTPNPPPGPDPSPMPTPPATHTADPTSLSTSNL